MNDNFNKHIRNIIVVLTIIVSILVACSYNNRKDNNTEHVDITDSCGINDDYYEINDVDTTNDGYSTDSVIYVDANGNIIKSPLNWVEVYDKSNILKSSIRGWFLSPE